MSSSAPDPGAPDAGIQRLSIPTPFAVGRVNCYLIDEEPLTLLDTGPNSGKGLDELERALAAHGRRVEDLERLVLSHHHPDHLGLIDVLARRSGAEVVTLDVLAPYVEGYDDAMEADDRFAEELMAAHGVPGPVRLALRAVARLARAWGARSPVTRTVRDGDTLDFAGRSLRVLHRPGHSRTDTVLLDEQRGVLLGADHLIAHISSNALVTRPEREGEPRPQSLVTYLESLRRTRDMDLELVLPGHGEPIADHRTLIDERIAGHERRAAKLARLIAERPRTAHELAQELWGNVALTQTYLTISEVLGHTDLLINRGEVREARGDDGVVRFEPA